MANVGFVDGMARRIPPARKKRVTEAATYKIVFSVCFTVFLWAMAIERLVPRQWRTLSDESSTTSLWRTAKDAAHSCTAIAFQG